MSAVRDRLWLWGHHEGSHNTGWNLPRPSSISPSDAAEYMGIENLIMVTYCDVPRPPFDDYAKRLSPLKRVVWSVVGDAGSVRNAENPDTDELVRISGLYPNIVGGIIDDFFNAADKEKPISRFSAEEILQFSQKLKSAPRPLDFWGVLYSHDLDLPIADYLEHFDAVTFWTWHAADIPKLEDEFARLEKTMPNIRKLLGCYMWDYGACRPMPVEFMEHQCQIGLKWLKEGRIEGMVFLASCICDIGLEAVEWTRRWIAETAEQKML